MAENPIIGLISQILPEICQAVCFLCNPGNKPGIHQVFNPIVHTVSPRFNPTLLIVSPGFNRTLRFTKF
jgi:hypothetical protein